MARRKTRRKPAPAASEEGSIQIGAIRKMSNVKFRRSTRRGSMYDPILEQMAKLKPHESFPIEVPEGTTPRDMHNRLNSFLTRAEERGEYPEPPKGFRFIKRTNAEGQIEMCCVED